jgi:hypothetical protein
VRPRHLARRGEPARAGSWGRVRPPWGGEGGAGVRAEDWLRWCGRHREVDWRFIPSGIGMSQPRATRG